MSAILLALWLSAPAARPDAEPSTVASSELTALSETARANRSACGPLSVWYVLDRLGQRTDADALVAAASPGEKGTSVQQLLDMLAERGHAASVVVTRKDRLSLLPVPSILLVGKGTHCIVYDGLDDQKRMARIFEPTHREVQWVAASQLQHSWSGEAIVLDRPRASLGSLVTMTILVSSFMLASTACVVFRRGRTERKARRAFTLTELLVGIGIAGILLAVLLPGIQYARESSRTTHCLSNLHQIGIALQSYESQHHVFPPAVCWSPPGEPLGMGIAVPGSIDRVSLGLTSATNPDRVYANWVITLLPHLDEGELYEAFDLALPIDDDANAGPRATELTVMKCPADPWNGPENHFQRSGLADADEGYARGNYAINGGTNRRCLTRLSARKIDCPDGISVDGTDLRRDTAQVWGNGVAGVNRAMRPRDFTSGLANTIFIEEIRAGLHPLDRRGAWPLGFPGSSITACHGMYGNNGPNLGTDAIQGCTAIGNHVADLEAQKMPCLKSSSDPRFEISERATARSMHVGGVNALMADGSTRFVDDLVDKRVWHRLHDRGRQEPAVF